jgi:DNA-binding response OmpR family regulator
MAVKRVLLVEPQFYTRVELEDALEPKGFQVTSVKDRYNALMKLKSQIFHLIMTGARDASNEVLFLLRSLREAGIVLPVVVLLSDPTASLVQRIGEYPPVEIVVMPYSLRELTRRMETVASRRR